MKNCFSHLKSKGLAHYLDAAKEYNILNERCGYFLFDTAGFLACEVKKQAIEITDVRGRVLIMRMDSEN